MRYAQESGLRTRAPHNLKKIQYSTDIYSPVSNSSIAPIVPALQLKNDECPSTLKLTMNMLRDWLKEQSHTRLTLHDDGLSEQDMSASPTHAAMLMLYDGMTGAFWRSKSVEMNLRALSTSFESEFK